MNPDGEIYLGLMSGTSLDGVDVAIADFARFPPRLLYCRTIAYADELRAGLHDLCRTQSTSIAALYRLDAQLGEVYAACVQRALEDAGIEPGQIQAIGCHGQTIAHDAVGEIAFSAQIGDPNRIAALTGITTVADFRRKDIALGGQAAPLAPAFHRFLFHDKHADRVVINIGGIANLTWLPADETRPVIGFDTGPGNTLCDNWIRQHHGSAFDDHGDWARGGRPIDALLQRMLTQEPYFRAPAPKSTGTEYFSAEWLKRHIGDSDSPQDVQATLVELTACSIADAVLALVPVPTHAYICGGGAHNDYLLERLQYRLPQCKLSTTMELGLDPDFVEATAFAWLARERLNLRSGNIPEVTRARRATVLGGVYRAE